MSSARTRLTGALGAAWLLGCLLFTFPARAQSASEVGAARELFERGLAATRERRWHAAEQAFAQSYAIVPRVSTLLNLGGALEQLGRFVEASEAFRRVLADRSTQAVRLHEGAEEALRRITPRIARLRWEIEGGARPGDRVLLDGAELAEATRGVDVPVDPGTHVLRIERGGTGRESQVEIEEGEQRLVLMTAPLLSSPEVSAVEEASLASDASRSEDDGLGASDDASRVRRRRRWIGVAAALVVVGAALAVGFSVAGSGGEPHRGNLGDGRIRF